MSIGRRLLALLAVALMLAACAPALQPTAERAGETVTVTLTATSDVYAVTLSVLNATTSDERCVVQSEVDVGCVIGDLEGGASTSVIVTGVAGEVQCRAFAFTEPDLALSSYRTFACQRRN